MTVRAILIAAAIVVAGAASSAAQGKGGGGGGGTTPAGSFAQGRLGLIEQAFVLKKEQTKQVKTVMDEASKSAIPVREQLAKTRAAIADAIHAKKPQADIDAAVNAYAVQAAAMTSLEMKTMARVLQSFEKEQRANSAAVSSLFFMMRGAFLEKGWDDVPGTRLY